MTPDDAAYLETAAASRFDLPAIGPALGIAFPQIVRRKLDNGLAVWVIARRAMPTVTLALLVDGGSARDPADRPGLAGLTADMLDEAAGGRDAVALADAFARLGSAAVVDVGPDVTTCACTTLSRHLAPAMLLLADLVVRPHMEDVDLLRVRELRQMRLRQLSASASAQADRAFIGAVFGSHPYGHGALGSTAALSAMTIDDVTLFHRLVFRPARATLIVAGDVTAEAALQAAERAFTDWAVGQAPAADHRALFTEPHTGEAPIVFVDRPGSPQSELRVGHRAPGRDTPSYHAMVTLNTILGGQFSSRLNANLREAKGYTYGARSAFDFRRAGGTFTCETSVQADATAAAVTEILHECTVIRQEGAVAAPELASARAALTRGYPRNFETAEQIVRAAAQLAIFGLPDETFDRFVPTVEQVGASQVAAAAQAFIRPDESAIVIVGDVQQYRRGVEALGRPVRVVAPEF